MLHNLQATSTSLLLGVLAALALAENTYPPLLHNRQFVPCNELGRKPCGDGCIPLTSTCCPDLKGGCPPTAYCSLGDNGDYGCCPLGLNCVGPGGASTDLSTITSTSTGTIIIPESSTLTIDTSIPTITGTFTVTSSTSETSSSISTSSIVEATSEASAPSTSASTASTLESSSTVQTSQAFQTTTVLTTGGSNFTQTATSSQAVVTAGAAGNIRHGIFLDILCVVMGTILVV
ncbi:hypothetical protein B0T17DRAFT_127500 [Bombardia bombarda]|uniref:GPI anchored serine-threonine rich protein n=1 Tax=Bombardia bombarda TaxID=252184 RepID=A0AA39U3C7_9PEZI|nr:hypothetical protein B0T17DRAFT_127500 [Bombardia bombarda]